MRSELFLNKCFESRKELGGTVCLLKTKKWGVGECRCFCDMVWLSHIGDFNGHLIMIVRIVVIVPILRYILVSLITRSELSAPP